MKNDALKNLTVESDKSIKAAMLSIELGGQGICFILQENKFFGVITDGDIRRALLRGIKIEDCVKKITKTDCSYVKIAASVSEIQKIFASGINIIPILNNENELVDFATATRFHQIPLMQPSLSGNELEYVTDCINSGWISSQGKYVTQFEEIFGKYVGGSYSLATSNGTVALHLALAALGVGPGDEVIVPNLTFAAPINAVIYVGAKPVLVDIEMDTLTIDTKSIEKRITKNTKAIIPVHLYGHPVNMESIMELANVHNLLVIEDCAEAIGSRCRGRHVGTFGDAAIFSFFGNKTLTTGEGGMLILKDIDAYKKAQVLRDHGMSRDRRYWHDFVGFNYRMTNLQAAIGVAQTERVEEFVSKKIWIANKYNEYLAGIEGVTLPGEIGDATNSYWLYTIVLKEKFSPFRDKVIARLKDCGVESRPLFYPIHEMPPYSIYVQEGQQFPISSFTSSAGISLPSSVKLTDDEIRFVCKSIKEILLSLN